MRLLRLLTLASGLLFPGCPNSGLYQFREGGLTAIPSGHDWSQAVRSKIQFDINYSDLNGDLDETLAVEDSLYNGARAMLYDVNEDYRYDCTADLYLLDRNEDGLIDLIKSETSCQLDYANLRENILTDDSDFNGRPDRYFVDFESGNLHQPDGVYDIEKRVSPNARTMQELFELLRE